MRLIVGVCATLAASAAAVQSNPHSIAKKFQSSLSVSTGSTPSNAAKKETNFQFLSEWTEQFLVDGANFPEVPFDIGESYAGLLENTPHGNTSLFFWFFPSENKAAKREITIWLNGGPGCSSLDGLLQENGPFLWQPGTYHPIRNMYSWTNLTNVVYIDQPAGTGFSPGPPSVNNEIDVSNQFNDFWRRFIETFCMQGYEVYIAGESYAGQYIPYIAEGFINQNDKDYFNLKGIQINDPSINDDRVMIFSPAVAALNHFSSVFSLNDTFMQYINAKDEKCGFTSWLNEVLTYPPPSPLPAPPDPYVNDCILFEEILRAVALINPCFSIYHLTDFCPYLWDELGFPSLGAGPNDYFNRSDVQEALHVPPTNYAICGEYDVFPNGDGSVPSALGPLPKVIEATNNVLIGHGWYDYLLFMNGSLATIQNMTWNGAQGFQTPPVEDFFVPYTGSLSRYHPVHWDGGAGILGKAHTERGLTFSSVYGSGHQIPQYVPGAAYRQLEFLLGRIDSLTQIGPFTTQ